MKQVYIVKVTPPKDAKVSFGTKLVEKRTKDGYLDYGDGRTETVSICVHDSVVTLLIDSVEIGELIAGV